MNKYLFLVSLCYAFPILRPLQTAIRKRGDEVKWFIDNPECKKYLREDEQEINSVQEVMEYNPVAVFTPCNNMYHFFPGIKVQLFHGFYINKRKNPRSHFALRGWFDLYCTQGQTTTKEFKSLSQKYGYFKVAETGWSKLDAFFEEDGKIHLPQNKKPTIIYCSTFSKGITSTPHLYDEIDRLIQEKEWDWLITFHPKMDKEIIERYRKLEKYENVSFFETDNNIELLKKADVMVSDSSSIIVEFIYLNKPVVTFRNTCPQNFMINIEETNLLEQSIEYALTRPEKLLQHAKQYIEKVNPYHDGKSSYRILEAVDNFLLQDKGRLKKKPLNLVRKLKARKKLQYFNILYSSQSTPSLYSTKYHLSSIFSKLSMYSKSSE